MDTQKKRILVVVERFFPEDFLVNDLVAAWQAQGHAVEVLTQVPSYPFDKIYDGYTNKRLQTTREFHDIPVHRVNTIFGYNTSVKRKVLNYLHFAWRTCCWALFHGRRFDQVFVYHTAALTMAAAVFPLRLLWRQPVTIWTQDLWPDAVWAFGFRPTRFRTALLNTFVRAVYGCCTRITVSCPGYVPRLQALIHRPVEWIPQWEPNPPDLSSVPAPDASRPTVFMFAGNLGKPQNLPNVVAGFLHAHLANAQLWLVGGGVMLEELQRQYGANPAIRFCGRQPRAEMNRWFAQADVLIISLTDAYSLTLPGKFQSYLHTGKPILGLIHGDTAALIKEHHLGWTANPDDLAAIANAYQTATTAVQTGEAKTLGENGLKTAKALFNRETAINRLLKSSHSHKSATAKDHM